jgi:hypothetical protein
MQKTKLRIAEGTALVVEAIRTTDKRVSEQKETNETEGSPGGQKRKNKTIQNEAEKAPVKGKYNNKQQRHSTTQESFLRRFETSQSSANKLEPKHIESYQNKTKPRQEYSEKTSEWPTNHGRRVPCYS